MCAVGGQRTYAGATGNRTAEQQVHLAFAVGLDSFVPSTIQTLAVRRVAVPCEHFGVGRAWKTPTVLFNSRTHRTPPTLNPHPIPSSPPEQTRGGAKAGWAHMGCVL